MKTKNFIFSLALISLFLFGFTNVNTFKSKSTTSKQLSSLETNFRPIEGYYWVQCQCENGTVAEKCIWTYIPNGCHCPMYLACPCHEFIKK